VLDTGACAGWAGTAASKRDWTVGRIFPRGSVPRLPFESSEKGERALRPRDDPFCAHRFSQTWRAAAAACSCLVCACHLATFSCRA